MNFSLNALQNAGCPIPLRLQGVDVLAELSNQADQSIARAAMDDRRSSTDGKEIITGDTVSGDDKPQIPDPTDDDKK